VRQIDFGLVGRAFFFPNRNQAAKAAAISRLIR
jgi:hypothetical protein